MDTQDYYEILEVPENASEKEIKDTYRRLALKYHPDRNGGNPEAVERMKSLNEAYAVLSHSDKKQEYDLLRRRFGTDAAARFRQSHTSEDIFRGSDIHRIFEEVARSFGLRGFEEVFREQYGNGFRTFEFQKPGFSARGFVFMGPFGRQGMKEMPGGATLGNFSRFLLEKMGGLLLPEEGKDGEDTLMLRPEEATGGGSFPYEEKRTARKLLVKIPAGVREGQRIRLTGLGKPGKNGGKPGDLYLRVHIRKPLLEKIGAFLSRFKK